MIIWSIEKTHIKFFEHVKYLINVITVMFNNVVQRY